MSLDVYLYTSEPAKVGSGIFYRENGETKELSRAEWDERFPDREPIIADRDEEYHEPAYHANITHNLNRMALEAGLYNALWRPDEIGITTASQLIEPLRTGLEKLKGSPSYFQHYNPDNGWGDYYGLVSFVERYLNACEEYPDARVSASR